MTGTNDLQACSQTQSCSSTLTPQEAQKREERWRVTLKPWLELEPYKALEKSMRRPVLGSKRVESLIRYLDHRASSQLQLQKQHLPSKRALGSFLRRVENDYDGKSGVSHVNGAAVSTVMS